MRHGNVQRKFGREKDQRLALMRSLASSLIVHGSMQTTLPRAKEIRPFVEKLVTKAKNPTVAVRRDLIATLGTTDHTVTDKLIERAKAYVERAGGYTRITKVETRASDAAPQGVISFV
ncbi:50S ribosomal protein L17 [Candidatus Campbellbacteria bacterium]|nr:MAG: 50S ribosomal protein L17 [Candidatus Campbellbacteria bacterium]